MTVTLAADARQGLKSIYSMFIQDTKCLSHPLDLMSAQIIDLHQVDWMPIKKKFGDLEQNIKMSLIKREVTPKDVVATLKSNEDTSHLLKSEHTILLEVKNKCLGCESIADLWLIVQDFFTFYSYDILTRVVDSGLTDEADNCKKQLDGYDDEFKSFIYSQKVIKEFFRSFDVATSSTSTKVIVKIKSTYTKFSDEHLENFKKKLATVLRVEPELFHLYSLQTSCTILTYHAPFIVEVAAFPLSAKQEALLKKLEVIWLICGKYQYPSDSEVYRIEFHDFMHKYYSYNLFFLNRDQLICLIIMIWVSS